MPSGGSWKRRCSTQAVLATPHGFGDDARSRILRQRPPASALEWVERALGGAVVGVRTVRGGVSSAMHAVRVEGAAGRSSVILRRYVIDDVTTEEPDIAEREAHVLGLLERCDLATPALLAVDPTGQDAGEPAVLMTRLPGRLDWSPTDLDAWLHDLAGVLPAIHAAPIDLADGVQPFRPYAPESWEPPPWLRDARLWERALEVFHAPPLDPDRVFVHRDYHPGNVLWRRGRVSGVVDWQAASIGPRAVDVFHCRGNLHGRFGLAVADRFVEIWESITGETYHPWAETVMLVDALDWVTRVGETAGERPIRAELEDLLAQRLAELGG